MRYDHELSSVQMRYNRALDRYFDHMSERNFARVEKAARKANVTDDELFQGIVEARKTDNVAKDHLTPQSNGDPLSVGMAGCSADMDEDETFRETVQAEEVRSVAKNRSTRENFSILSLLSRLWRFLQGSDAEQTSRSSRSSGTDRGFFVDPAWWAPILGIGSAAGLPNVGSSCFANSVLQTFFLGPGSDRYVALLDQELFRRERESESEYEGRLALQSNLLLLRKEHLSEHPDMLVVEGCLRKIVSHAASRWGRTHACSQEDAGEFLGILFNDLEAARSPSVTCGIKTVVKTGGVEIRSNRPDDCQILSVNDRGDTLQESIDKFLADADFTDLEGNDLVTTPVLVPASLSNTPEPPKNLVMTINRMAYTEQDRGHKLSGMQVGGVDQSVAIPFRVRTTGEGENPEEGVRTVRYRVRSVICHSGSTGSGHYFTLLRKENGAWEKRDDSMVVPISEKAALATASEKGYVISLEAEER
ncbi:MAG: ubiquitin carboxyl-terminal hydrolase family protein [Simkaniaceae bacterium]|nr:ubiquitin carboxyl-terminal hydrolase family protein [Simkaniaceae bacterium]